MSYESPAKGPLMEPIAVRIGHESYSQAVARMQRELLRRTLRAHAGDLSKSAADLSMPLEQFEEELDRLGISH